jgi:hypothetical protein
MTGRRRAGTPHRAAPRLVRRSLADSLHQLRVPMQIEYQPLLSGGELSNTATTRRWLP